MAFFNWLKSIFSWKQKTPENPAQSVKTTIVPAQEILKNNPRINKTALSFAFGWKDAPEITNKKYILLVDYSLNEKLKRAHLINMQDFTSKSYKVAHGKNSDQDKDGMADHFSNVNGTLQSSLGPVLIGKEFHNPKWKMVRLLYGLQKGLNDNIEKREIVMHSTTYVNDVEGQSIGDTWGCFGFSEKSAAEIFPLVQGCLLYAWDDSLKS